MKFRWKLLMIGAIIFVGMSASGIRGQADEDSAKVSIVYNNTFGYNYIGFSMTKRAFTELNTVQDLIDSNPEETNRLSSELPMYADISELSNGIITADNLNGQYTPDEVKQLVSHSENLKAKSNVVNVRSYEAKADGSNKADLENFSEKSFDIETFLNTRLEDVMGFIQQSPSLPIVGYSFSWKVVERENDKSKMTVNYTSSDNQAAVPAIKTITGYAGEVLPVDKVIPKIPGYVADKQALKMADPAEDDQSVTVHYQKVPNKPAISVPAMPVQQTDFQPFMVYGKRKLYRYSRPTFTHATRLQGYAKKTRAYAPQFKVVGTAQSTQGRMRYQLADGTYVTARPDYVAKLHWQSYHGQLYVTHPQGLQTYANAQMTRPDRWLKQGTAVTVTQIKRQGMETSFVLADGTYMSGSKQWVSVSQPKQATRLKVKKTVRLSRDIDGREVIQTLKPGTKLTVKGWDYTRRADSQRQGVKRYKTTRGYVTANTAFIDVIA